MDKGTGQIEGWFIVAQMGHRTLIGMVRQIQMGDTALLRIDIPEHTRETNGWNEEGRMVATKETYDARFEIVSPASIYMLTPVTEEKAMELLKTHASIPTWVAPKLVSEVPQFEQRQLTAEPPF